MGPGVIPGPFHFRRGEIAMADRPLLIVSTPRSGTDWFLATCLASCLEPGTLVREFFSPVSTPDPQLGPILSRAFGSEDDWLPIAAPAESQAHLDEVFAATWPALGGRFRVDKEVWSAFKTRFFAAHFDCVGFIGHRRSTFPGASQQWATMHWYTQYYRSLIHHAPSYEEDVRGLVTFASAEARTARDEVVAAQIIATYKIVKDCHALGLPIIESRRLIDLPGGEVAGYLRERLPRWIDVEALASIAVATRRMTHDEKRQAYDEFGAEPFAARLIGQLESYREFF